jgi:cytochrome c-type biogenesis protein CcmE
MERTLASPPRSTGRLKFIIGGVLIIAAVVYLIVSSTSANAQYFLTLDELKAKAADLKGSDVRISGAVVGSSIQYDSKTLTLTFVVANVPADNNVIEAQGGLAAVLHAAVINPSNTRLTIVYNGVKPDLLKDEAQAIVTGKMGQDGNFYATDLLLKCPSKYQQAVPSQVPTTGQVSQINQ